MHLKKYCHLLFTLANHSKAQWGGKKYDKPFSNWQANQSIALSEERKATKKNFQYQIFKRAVILDRKEMGEEGVGAHGLIMVNAGGLKALGGFLFGGWGLFRGVWYT